jgi:hypothetical protein
MSARCLTLALSLLVAMPVFSQGARFIKVDIVGKSVKAACKNADGPTEVHVRMPINLAKGFLETLSSGEVRIHKNREGRGPKEPIKVDQLVKLLESAKPGDLLLEVTTDKGDLVKVTLE